MTSDQLAAWVQAVGSIVAILAAVVIAWRQSASQHRSVLELFDRQRIASRDHAFAALAQLASTCHNIVADDDFQDRERLARYAGDRAYLQVVLGLAKSVQQRLHDLSLHELPTALIPLTLGLESALREHLADLDKLTRDYRSLSDQDFDSILAANRHLRKFVSEICEAIATSRQSG